MLGILWPLASLAVPTLQFCKASNPYSPCCSRRDLCWFSSPVLRCSLTHTVCCNGVMAQSLGHLWQDVYWKKCPHFSVAVRALSLVSDSSWQRQGIHMVKENWNFYFLCLPQSSASLLLLSGREPWVTIILALILVSGLRQCTAYFIFAAQNVLCGIGDLPLFPSPDFPSATERENYS